VDSIDGLVTELSKSALASAPVEHGNGALGIDHVVVTTPDFNRTAAALAEVGMELRRIRELPGGSRQGFRRVGPAILELVEAPAEDASGPARFWGLVVVVSDLDRLAERLSPLLGRVKPAVQPGRRIATLGAAAGVSPAVAFMTPEP
jgi:sensor domain CHASE-containing protein